MATLMTDKSLTDVIIGEMYRILKNNAFIFIRICKKNVIRTSFQNPACYINNKIKGLWNI